jgi:hypothetical protein
VTLDQRMHDALDAAAGVYEAPDDLFDRVTLAIADDARRGRRLRITGATTAVLAAAAIAALVVVAQPDGRTVKVQPADPTTTAPALTSTTTEAPTTTTDVTPPPPAPPATFAGLLTDGRLVLADSLTGRVVRTLVQPREGESVGSMAQSSDGKVVFFGLGDRQASSVMKMSTAGGQPTRIGDGCMVGLSPDNAFLVHGGCRADLAVTNLHTGETRRVPNGEFPDSVFDVKLVDADTVVFGAAGEEMPTVLYRLDVGRHRTLSDAQRLGPPDGSGAPWHLGGTVSGDGPLRVIEYCCMKDAEPDPSDTADLLLVDLASGKVLDRQRLTQDMTAFDVDATGTAELYLGQFFELFRREGDRYRRLSGEWHRVDW